MSSNEEGMVETNYWTRRYGRRRIFAGAGSLALASGFLAACGSDEDGPGATVTSTPSGDSTASATASTGGASDVEGQQGGSIVVPNASDIQRLDFHQTISTPTQEIAGMVHNRLMEFDPQTPANDYTIRPDLAESWETNPDKFTFKLRQGVKWQNIDPVNGRELVAEDIKYSYERARTEGADWVWGYKLAAIESIETPDDYTVVMNLKAPSATLLGDLAHGPGMYITPRELVEADGDLDKRWIGTGPFVLESFEPGNFQQLTRNPDYFRSGRPFLDSVRVQVISDQSAQLANFLAGQIAMLEVGGIEDVEQIERSTGVKVIRYGTLTSDNINYAAGPTGTPEMQDIRVRQAIDSAIDRNQLIEIAFGGEATISGPIIPLNMGIWSLSEAEVREEYEQNLAESRKLLAAAGITSLQIPLTYSNVDPQQADMLPIVKQHLAQVGIDVELLPEERAIYLQRGVDADFVMQCVGSGTGPDPDSLLYPYWHTDGGKNWARISNPDFDALIEAEQSMLDEAERVEAIHSIARDWKSKYMYRTHMLFPNAYKAWQTNVKNGFVRKGADWRPFEEVSLIS